MASAQAILILVVLAIFAAGATLLARRRGEGKIAPRFTARPVFSKSEEEFFVRLCAALPGCSVFPKLVMSALLESRDSQGKRNARATEMIYRERVDYAVFDRQFKLVCVIDLSERLIGGDQDAVNERDLGEAGIKVVRWSRTSLPKVEQIHRAISPLVSQSVPKPEPEPRTLEQDTVYMMYRSDPAPSNIQGLSQAALDQLTPHKVLHNSYPHIWQRICQFSVEPKHLQKYLLSLAIQDRGGHREGFSFEVLREISDIQAANDRFIMNAITGWQSSFINR